MNYRGYRKKVNGYQSSMKYLTINKELGVRGCWRFEKGYQTIEGVTLHQVWASGEGEVVRHLCGESKCVNPLHLIRGSDIENAEDEIKIRDYSVKLLQTMIDENYDNYPRDLAMLTLMPRVSRIKKDLFSNMREVAAYAREKYRKLYEEVAAETYTDDEVNSVIPNLKWLASKRYISIIKL